METAVLGTPARPVTLARVPSAGGPVTTLLVGENPHGDEFLRALTTQLGLAIGNARRLDQEAESVRRLTDLAQLRSSLLGGVSHELRTPLTAMMGFAQTLRTRELPPETQAEFLDLILRQGKRLQSLIGDLLDETRLETGVVNVTCTPVTVPELLHDVAASFIGIKQTLSIEVDPALEPIWADRDRLEQALVNIVHNATKYGPNGTLIRIRANGFADEVAISVIDDGPGIDPQFLPRTFDAFTQADVSDTRRDSGLGLGLAISRGFVEAMGGRITAESRLGEGSTFVLYLKTARAAPKTLTAAPGIPVPREYVEVEVEPEAARA